MYYIREKKITLIFLLSYDKSNQRFSLVGLNLLKNVLIQTINCKSFIKHFIYSKFVCGFIMLIYQKHDFLRYLDK